MRLRRLLGVGLRTGLGRRGPGTRLLSSSSGPLLRLLLAEPVLLLLLLLELPLLQEVGRDLTLLHAHHALQLLTSSSLLLVHLRRGRITLLSFLPLERRRVRMATSRHRLLLGLALGLLVLLGGGVVHGLLLRLYCWGTRRHGGVGGERVGLLLRHGLTRRAAGSPWRGRRPRRISGWVDTGLIALHLSSSSWLLLRARPQGSPLSSSGLLLLLLKLGQLHPAVLLLLLRGCGHHLLLLLWCGPRWHHPPRGKLHADNALRLLLPSSSSSLGHKRPLWWSSSSPTCLVALPLDRLGMSSSSSSASSLLLGGKRRAAVSSLLRWAALALLLHGWEEGLGLVLGGGRRPHHLPRGRRPLPGPQRKLGSSSTLLNKRRRRCLTLWLLRGWGPRPATGGGGLGWHEGGGHLGGRWHHAASRQDKGGGWLGQQLVGAAAAVLEHLLAFCHHLLHGERRPKLGREPEDIPHPPTTPALRLALLLLRGRHRGTHGRVPKLLEGLVGGPSEPLLGAGHGLNHVDGILGVEREGFGRSQWMPCLLEEVRGGRAAPSSSSSSSA